MRLDLLTNAGGVGLGSANLDLRGAASLDLGRLPPELPLAAHVNLGYLVNQAGAIADRIERDRARELGTKQRITRVERFAQDFDRVDALGLGLGVAGKVPYASPFVEWSIEVPVNRQQHLCREQTRTLGDSCLATRDTLAVMPSRVTLGVQGFPRFSELTRGLTALVAFDVATGGARRFIEEVAPEPPWMLHLGLGYTIDTVPHVRMQISQQTVERVVTAPAPARPVLQGTVTDEATGEGILGAVATLADSDSSPVLTNANGSFRISDVTRGPQRLQVTAEGYQPGECATVVPAPPPGKPGAPAAATAPIEVRCALTALPRSATVVGSLRDAATTEYVSAASVQVTDARGRSLSLTTDALGAFRFENVPAGKITLRAEAAGYLPSVTELELLPRKDVTTALFVHRRPAVSNVVVTRAELKLKRQIHFLHDSAAILPDSESLVEEIGEALRQHPEVTKVEIQGHTDDTGSPQRNTELSAARAESVRRALVEQGIDPSRLSVQGYGAERPLVPNTSPANRAKNRRVQLMVLP